MAVARRVLASLACIGLWLLAAHGGSLAGVIPLLRNIVLTKPLVIRLLGDALPGMKRESGAESVAQSGPFGACPSWSHYTQIRNLISCQTIGGL